jgi:phosphoribosyl 1,2-cyclic phosphodiesterase
MRLRVFGSGSQGNALAVRSGGTLLLVDCGFSCRELERRMSACGVRADDVTALLFTHDHTDHCKGIATFHKRHPQVPLYANGNTADAIATLTGVEDGWRVFETSEPFAIGDIDVTSFSIPHDAADAVGYLFSDETASLFVGTDMGVPTLPVKYALARATCAVLESNHDPALLACSDRPVSLKQRIAGRCGHLSNQDAADLVREVAPPRLKTLLLAHLSQPCNAPHLALESMREALKDINRADVTLATLDQDEPSDLYEI